MFARENLPAHMHEIEIEAMFQLMGGSDREDMTPLKSSNEDFPDFKVEADLQPIIVCFQFF